MNVIHSTRFSTAYGEKTLSVVAQDVTTLGRHIDVLTTSAFHRSYHPTPRTLFAALHGMGINVNALAEDPFIDLRLTSNIWLSHELEEGRGAFGYIGCIESSYKFTDGKYGIDLEKLLASVKAYFYLLDIASASGVKVETVALPLLGTGSQNIAEGLIITPLLGECVAFLKRNEQVREILFVERNEEKAYAFAEAVRNSYLLFKETSPAVAIKENKTPTAFISYTSHDRNVADNLCFKLESRGIKVWYAPRNVVGPYAAAITDAIGKADYFIVILSRACMMSEHVLNEIDLAFQRLPNHIKFKPLRIDTADLEPSFKYYLSRQHWMDAHIPPVEARIDEFVDALVEDASTVNNK